MAFVCVGLKLPDINQIFICKPEDFKPVTFSVYSIRKSANCIVFYFNFVCFVEIYFDSNEIVTEIIQNVKNVKNESVNFVVDEIY